MGNFPYENNTKTKTLQRSNSDSALYTPSVMQIGLNPFKIVNEGLNHCRDQFTFEGRQKDEYHQGFSPHSIPPLPFVWPLTGQDKKYSKLHKMLICAV